LSSPVRPFRFPPRRPQFVPASLAQVLSRLPALKAGAGDPASTAPGAAVAFLGRGAIIAAVGSLIEGRRKWFAKFTFEKGFTSGLLNTDPGAILQVSDTPITAHIRLAPRLFCQIRV
jgi:hypothetical protein